MSITINGATNTITAASGLTVAGNTAVTGTLSATGNVGVAGTPAAWYNSSAISVGGWLDIGNGDGSASVRVLSNAYAAGNGDWRSRQGTFGSLSYRQNPDTLTFTWSTAPAVAIDTAVTWTDRMTLNTTGLAVTGTVTSSVANGNSNLVITDSTNSKSLYLNNDNGAWKFFDSAPTLIATISSTGLAVTGTGTFSGNLTAKNASASPWSVGAVDLSLAGAVYGDGLTYGWFAGVTQNAYNEGGTWKYKTSTGGVRAQRFNLDSTSFVWSSAAAGTAGAAITWTDHMTLDASGNLAVTGSVSTTLNGTLNNKFFSMTDSAASGVEWALYNRFAATAGRFAIYDVTNAAAALSVEYNKSLALQGATPASGTGITFPATQNASADANTLDDYEEGTWTPTDASGAALSLSVTDATYTKIGRQVTVRAQLAYPVTADATQAVVGGLPFTVSGTTPAIALSGALASLIPNLVTATTTMSMRTGADGGVTNAQLSNSSVFVSATYFV